MFVGMLVVVAVPRTVVVVMMAVAVLMVMLVMKMTRAGLAAAVTHGFNSSLQTA